ncbi:MAG TPA: AAA family ATPase [Candidatus Saccharimonadales bacterium]|nr:AAA family ATPase [Candidatus Saccharimonadales bacterium]
MKIIGISGTNGSGKDTLSEILAEYGWLFISASRDLIIPELERLGLPLERKHMAELTAEWNRKAGRGAVVDKAVECYKEQSKTSKFKGLVISSIRHPWEADRIHELGGKIVWVDADPKIRYQRIYSRGHGTKDQKTFKEFLAEEEKEMRHSGDKATLNISGVKDKADIFLENNGDDVEVFKKTAKTALEL